MSHAPASALLREIIVFAGCLALAIGLTMVLGHDANWDLRNYHLYNAYAFYHERYHLDLMPVGVQSYLNPLMDIPYFIIVKRYGLQPASIYLSVYYGALIYVAWKINQLVFEEIYSRGISSALSARLIFPLTATVLGASGAATLSQSATTFNEIQLALLILAGVFILLLELRTARMRLGPAALAGLLFGAAAGLKLTAAIYAPAVVIAMALAIPAWRTVVPVIALCVGWMVGALVTFGWWGWLLFRLFENPIFPFYNGLFRSSWFPPFNFEDGRFFPKNLLEWLFYPFGWAVGPSQAVAEPLMQDPRLALLLVALVILVVFFRRLLAQSVSLRFFLIFGFLSYLVWLTQFSVLRYAVSIEIMAGTTISLLLAVLLSLRGRAGTPAVVASSVILLAVVQFATTYPHWGRIDFTEKKIYFELPDVPPQTLVLMNGQPTGFLIPFIDSEGVAFLGALPQAAMAKDFGLVKKMRARIADHRGPLRIIIRHEPDVASLSVFGVEAVLETCKGVRTNIEYTTDIMICDARRL